MRVSPKLVRKYLGVQRYRFGRTELENRIGVTTGLAYTEVGGDLLQMEVSVTPGKGKLLITGRLGEVMQESANAAMSYIRSRAKQLGLTSDFHDKVDIHIHVPDGGTPKDGPSAGITLATTIASALTRIPVRANVAMTGEITLRGRVLPIGGLKEKLIAAHRGGIDTVLIPKDNEKDLKDLPEIIKKNIRLIPVDAHGRGPARSARRDRPQSIPRSRRRDPRDRGHLPRSGHAPTSAPASAPALHREERADASGGRELIHFISMGA